MRVVFPARPTEAVYRKAGALALLRALSRTDELERTLQAPERRHARHHTHASRDVLRSKGARRSLNDIAAIEAVESMGEPIGPCAGLAQPLHSLEAAASESCLNKAADAYLRGDYEEELRMMYLAEQMKGWMSGGASLSTSHGVQRHSNKATTPMILRAHLACSHVQPALPRRSSSAPRRQQSELNGRYILDHGRGSGGEGTGGGSYWQAWASGR